VPPDPPPHSLISTSTPAGRSSFMSESTVCGVGSTMSSRRLWVRISNCSRSVLSTGGLRGPARPPAGPGLHDLFHRPVKQLVVVRLQANPDLLIGSQGCHALLRDLRDHARPHRPDRKS